MTGIFYGIFWFYQQKYFLTQAVRSRRQILFLLSAEFQGETEVY